eukprot:SAG31_NODE_21693_length_543_cov_0.853604_1_plen_69_part_01
MPQCRLLVAALCLAPLLCAAAPPPTSHSASRSCSWQGSARGAVNLSALELSVPPKCWGGGMLPSSCLLY